MDLKRRSFLKLAGFFSLAAFGNCSALLADIFQAPSGTFPYPGKIKPLNEAEIRCRSKWLG